ncbi:MAG: DUF3576 domain-containing protein [Alphaproteobacteria bacterium]|nr:DUF3576 domain-containing protein [Alphaproteobacteria bacterium]
MKNSFAFVPVALGALLLSACGGDIVTDPTYSDKPREDLYKHGSLVSDEGGWSLLGGKEKKSSENNGIGVNGFLWRASLDTVSFMPIASADPFGGVILTDWYSTPDAPKERAKLNIIIRDRELTATGVKVTVFRQVKNAKGVWENTTTAPATASAMENAILTRARQLRISQKQFD